MTFLILCLFFLSSLLVTVIYNINLNTSQELFEKIQKELIIILESYSMSLEKEVNSDSIEVQAFYRYLKTVSKDSL